METTNKEAVARLLRRHFEELKAKNPAFSLRAFAKKAGIRSSAISEILNGKRSISRALASRIAVRLGVGRAEYEKLLSYFPPEGTKAPRKRVRQVTYRVLDADTAQVISDWYHYAILHLVETKGYRHDPKWVARRLGIEAETAAASMACLERLGMIERTGSGAVRPTGISYSTTEDVASKANRKTHSQCLKLAQASLDHDDVSIREFTAITMAIDPKRIPEAKRRIRKFRDRLCTYLEAKDKREVYRLCIQLFPLSRGDGAGT